MADALAIAAATAGFAHAVGEALIGLRVSAAPQVHVGRPPIDPAFVGVSIFMYLVTPSVARRNADLATRDGAGAPLRRPGAALELHFLVSCHGEERVLDPQLIMGAVIARLHGAPILDAAYIRDALTAAGPHGPMAGAEWGASEAPLRATPVDLDLESTHRLWSLLPQTPYAPSLAYTLSAVTVEAGDIPARALPVRRLDVRTACPRPFAPVLHPRVADAGTVLRLRSPGLAGTAGVVFRAPENDAPALVVTAQVAGDAVALPVPDSLGWGRWRVALRLGTGDDAVETETADLTLLPHLCDGATWRPVRSDDDQREIGGQVVCTVSPASPAGPLLLELHPAPGGAVRAPARTARALRAMAPVSVADALDAGRTPSPLLAALAVAGAPSDRTWAVFRGDTPGAWRLASGDDRVRVSRQADGLLVEAGLMADDPADAIVFRVAGPLLGEHLLRVRAEDDPSTASALRLGLRVADLGAADVSALVAGRTPEAVEELLRGAGAPITGALHVDRVGPGDGWRFLDEDGHARGWARPEEPGAGLYALDVPGAAYFGPSVKAPT